jgi:hypothetical protein
LGIQQSTRAWASLDKPRPWGICDRCGFRYFHHDLNWQYDWRGNQLQNLRILVDHRCTDVPQPQLRPIIIGPDPYPVEDPRPGWAAQQGQGSVTYLYPVGPPAQTLLYNDGGVLALTEPSNWPTSSGAPGALYDLGGVVAISLPTTPNPLAPPVFFPGITATALLALGGANLPIVSPPVGSNQVWNFNGVAYVA